MIVYPIMIFFATISFYHCVISNIAKNTRFLAKNHQKPHLTHNIVKEIFTLRQKIAYHTNAYKEDMFPAVYRAGQYQQYTHAQEQQFYVLF